MITGDKVIELFCMADDFCKFFDRMVAKYTFKSAVKRSYHRNSIMSKAEIMLITVYCCFPKKPCINVERTLDTQLTLFWIRRTHVKFIWGNEAEASPCSFAYILPIALADCVLVIRIHPSQSRNHAYHHTFSWFMIPFLQAIIFDNRGKGQKRTVEL